jgi:Metallo-peptidase family M12B Reprolysin-like
MRTGLLFFAAFICVLSSATLKAQQSLWTKVKNNSPGNYSTSLKQVSPRKSSLSKIDLTRLKNILQSAPLEKNDGRPAEGISFSIPLPDETILTTSVVESPVWESKYAAQFSHLKTYTLTDPVTNSSQGRITVTAEGINGIIFSDKGTVYINPVSEADPGTHVSYYAQDQNGAMPACGSPGDGAPANEMQLTQRITAGDGNRRTYRLAVAATAEYTAWAGSQVNAVTYITISINNVIAVYDRDLNVRFTIVSPNSILFTNAATDPYPGGNVYLDDAATNANQTALDNIIGTAAYDLGIVFNHGWDRGYVPLPFGFVCNAASKGKSAAGLLAGRGQNPVVGPQGMAFDLTVAHEIAHQFGATHSFSSNVGTCGVHGNAAATFEPGGGSTLMSYGGYPDCNTYVSYAEMYFHAGNIAQIQTYISGPGNCVTPTVTGNTAPVLNIAAATYTIPVSTPFTLTATGTDADGNTL